MKWNKLLGPGSARAVKDKQERNNAEAQARGVGKPGRSSSE